MANKRELKKEINFISNELIAECLFNKLYIKNSDPQKIDELLSRIINCQDDFLRRVNTPDGKENPKLVKKYYKSLIQSFDNKIGEILKELGLYFFSRPVPRDMAVAGQVLRD